MRAYGSSVLRLNPIVVAVGGAAGAGLRWLVTDLVGHNAYPWATLVVNIVGAFILGLLIRPSTTERQETAKLGLGVGFCGGLTTFSSFAVALAQQLRDGRVVTASSYLVVSLLVGILAIIAGALTRRRFDPLLRP